MTDVIFRSKSYHLQNFFRENPIYFYILIVLLGVYMITGVMKNDSSFKTSKMYLYIHDFYGVEDSKSLFKTLGTVAIIIGLLKIITTNILPYLRSI